MVSPSRPHAGPAAPQGLTAILDNLMAEPAVAYPDATYTTMLAQASHALTTRIRSGEAAPEDLTERAARAPRHLLGLISDVASVAGDTTAYDAAWQRRLDHLVETAARGDAIAGDMHPVQRGHALADISATESPLHAIRNALRLDRPDAVIAMLGPQPHRDLLDYTHVMPRSVVNHLLDQGCTAGMTDDVVVGDEVTRSLTKLLSSGSGGPADSLHIGACHVLASLLGGTKAISMRTTLPLMVAWTKQSTWNERLQALALRVCMDGSDASEEQLVTARAMLR